MDGGDYDQDGITDLQTALRRERKKTRYAADALRGLLAVITEMRQGHGDKQAWEDCIYEAEDWLADWAPSPKKSTQKGPDEGGHR
jgi:hypothetical protein